MKSREALLCIAMLVLPVESIWAQSGDIALWIPDDTNAPEAVAQIRRNTEYISIKLHSAYLHYESGYFENIGQIVVASDIGFQTDDRTLRSTMINKVVKRKGERGEYIGGINDHLAILSPATPVGIKLKVTFRGIGDDRFAKVFEALSDPTLKTAFNLSQATLGRISAVAPIVQRFLTSPYTADAAKQILDLEQSFVLYPSTKRVRPDSLRDGYIVVVSAVEGKNESLSKLLQLERGAIRVSQHGLGLEYRSNGSWSPVASNSYVIFSIARSSTRGEDEYALWFRKYSDSIAAARKVREGVDVAKAKEDALVLFREGNTLLAADSNYIESERDSIRSGKYERIKGELRSIDIAKAPTPAEFGVPANFGSLAAAYRKATIGQWASIQGAWPNELVSAVRYKPVKLYDAARPTVPVATTHTDSNGKFKFEKLRPGAYFLEAFSGTGAAAKEAVVLDPKAMGFVDLGRQKLHW